MKQFLQIFCVVFFKWPVFHSENKPIARRARNGHGVRFQAVMTAEMEAYQMLSTPESRARTAVAKSAVHVLVFMFVPGESDFR